MLTNMNIQQTSTEKHYKQQIQCPTDNIELKSRLKIHKNICSSILKVFECTQCNLTFDRASQLDYHYRRIHLGERSQVCEICGTSFFRKADLRTHMSIHLGTSTCICEICGKRFNHISNLLRHRRIHEEFKRFLCSICYTRFTQYSSLVRHKRKIHGRLNESTNQYSDINLTSNKLQADDSALKENETIANTIDHKYYEKTAVESRHQNINKESVQRNKSVSNQHNIDIDDKIITLYFPLETVVCIAPKQPEENNLTGIENTNSLSQDYLAGIEEKLESTDIQMNKTTLSYPIQDMINNHKQTEGAESKDNVIYLHQFNTDNLIFPSQEKSNAESENHNSENILRSNNSNMSAQDCKDAPSKNAERPLNIRINSQTYNPSEDRKPLNDDDYNQLYIDLIDSGLLKFDESRYSNNTDSTNVNLTQTIKSQHSTNIANNITHTSVAVSDDCNLLHNERTLDNLNNSDNIELNNDEPILRLMQTETGEQFYEFIINNLVEKIQNISCTKDLENKIEESQSTFTNCKDVKESHENNDQIEHQQTFHDLTDISNEFSYTQFDFHREEKNSSVSYHNESEHFQQNLEDNECTDNMQEKNIQAYNPMTLELLENVSHVELEKYIETNVEVFDRVFVQNDEELLQLIELQDSQIEQESNQDFVQANDFDKSYSDILQNNSKITNFPENKLDYSICIKNNMIIPKNINDQNIKSKERHTESNKHLYTNLMNNENLNENYEGISEEIKKLKISQKKFQCSVCKKVLSTAYNYKQHIGIHFADQQQFRCKECSMSFAWKSTLNKHIANNHNSDGPQKFVCDSCPKFYSNMSQVNEHMKRDHLKLRNYVCLYCGKSFFKNSDLKMHNRMHTNERPYICPVCGKSFHHQSHIIRHARTHSGDKPYTCNICQNTFTQLGSLKVHKQKHR